jgi:hypothetical protein
MVKNRVSYESEMYKNVNDYMTRSPFTDYWLNNNRDVISFINCIKLNFYYHTNVPSGRLRNVIFNKIKHG